MKLTVSNFQVHKSKTLDIPEGETTYLEGDSDTGKSAMLRAIRWLGENKPDGGSFVTFKTPRGTTSVVTLEIDGHVITRERGKSKNLYSLDGEVYEAFGRSVPDPILKVLRLSPYAFQLQGETPFLIGATPTEAAKILAEACDLGVIDTAVGAARAKKTAADADIRKTEILLESAEARMKAAQEQLPLADALDCAVLKAEEAEALNLRAQRLAVALEDEPLGEEIDLTAARGASNAARLAKGLVDSLLSGIAGAQKLLAEEPQGVLYDLGDVPHIAEAARMTSKECGVLVDRIEGMRRLLAAEPQGGVFDIGPAIEKMREACVLKDWLLSVKTDAGRIDALLAAEPKGTLIDTTELQKQRAAIKVCPTCGKEL